MDCFGHVLAERDMELAGANYLRFIVQWSSIALIWYDYALTFGHEVKYIWGQRFRISTALYICCRYALVTNVLNLLVISRKFGDACDQWSKAITSLAVLGRFAIIITFTARTYIICDRSRCVLGYLSALGLAWMIVSLVYLSNVDCSGKSDIRSVILLLNTLMGVFEFSSALITFSRCMYTVKVTKGMGMRAHRFFMILLEQGVLYLVFATLFTVTTILLNYLAPPITLYQRLLNGIALPLSCIFTARFLLHLRWLEEQLRMGSLGLPGAIEEQETAGPASMAFQIPQSSSIVVDLAVVSNVDDSMHRYASLETSNWSKA